MKCLVIDRPYMGIGGIENIQIRYLNIVSIKDIVLFGLQPRSMKNLPPIKTLQMLLRLKSIIWSGRPLDQYIPHLNLLMMKMLSSLQLICFATAFPNMWWRDWQCHTVSHFSFTIPHFKGRRQFCLKYVYAPVVLVNAGDCDFQMLPSGLIEREIL